MTLTITNDALIVWTWRLDKFNSGSGEPPLTLEQYIQARFDENTARYQTAINEENQTALAGNPKMAAIAAALLDLDSKEMETKLAQIEALVLP